MSVRKYRHLGPAVRRSAAAVMSALLISAVVAVAPAHADPAPSVSSVTEASIPAGMKLNAVACGTATSCVAVGEAGAVLPIVGHSLGTSAVATDGSKVVILSAIACPSSSMCIAVGSEYNSSGPEVDNGVIVSVSNGSPGAVKPYSGVLAFTGISCVSATSCFATGNTNRDQSGSGPSLILHLTNGQPGTADSVSDVPYLNAISCGSNSTCLAIGTTAEPSCPGCSDGALVPVVNGLVQPTTKPADVGGWDNVDMSCADGSACTLGASGHGGALGVGFSTGQVAQTMGGTYVAGSENRISAAIHALSCPLRGYCLAAAEDFYGDSFSSYDNHEVIPIVNGQLAAPTLLSQYLLGIACPTPSVCVGVGAEVAFFSIALPTTTTLAVSANPVVGQPTTLTATVSTVDGASTPTGSVTFKDTTTGQTLGTSSLNSSGVATLTTSALTAGGQDLEADYLGSSADGTSSATTSISVSKGQPTVTLTPSANPGTYGKNMTLTVQVSGPPGLPTPSGTVTFRDAQTQLILGTASLDSSGAARVPTSALAAGQHQIAALYSGDAEWQPGSATITETVNSAPTGVVAENNSYQLNGIGCGSAGECIAVGFGPEPGGEGIIGVLVHQDGDRIGAPGTVAGTQNLKGLACASPTACFAVGESSSGSGVVVPIKSDVAGTPISIPGTFRLDAITCPSSSSCLAVGFDAAGNGELVPIGLGGPGAVKSVGAGDLLHGIACESESSCVAVGEDAGNNEGVVVPITSGTPGPQQDVSGTGSLNAVTCASSSSCTAVGQNAQSTAGVTVPIDLGSVGSVATDANALQFFGVDCASSTSCVAVGESTDPFEGVVANFGSGRGFANTSLAGTYQFNGVACDTSTTCTAVGENVGQGVLDPLTLGGSTFIQTMTLTRTSLTSSANPSTFGQSVTFTATITPPASGAPLTGSVTFKDATTGATLRAVAVSSSGVAAFTYAALAVGTHTITATYSGGDGINPSTTSLAQTVNKAATTLVATKALKGKRIFSAKLTRTDNGAAVNGATIVFSLLNPSTHKQDTVCTAVSSENGVATCTGTVPTIDQIFVSSYLATFAGTPNYVASKSSAAYANS